MKKKFLLAAMLAGLGFGGSANAVHVNPDGLGQVLLYPYYTVQNGFDTYVHVVNTTDRVKAVKVRFLEGMNSQEVLDFNLYLSPYDVWTGVITRTETGAKVSSTDTSCIAPRQLPAEGEPFRNVRYALDNTNTLARTREGYLEIIEMGVVNESFVLDTVNVADAATHVHNADVAIPSVPLNCAIVRKAASATISGGGQFNTNSPSYISAPTGGLYGFASVINVGAGLKTSYSATALDNFTDLDAIHFAPGNTRPSLEDVTTNGDILNNASIITYPWSAVRPVDTVSAVLMRSAIYNDYVVDAARESKTDWVITFPTKRFYVGGAGGNSATTSSAATPPFQRTWAGNLNLGANVPRGGACDTISLAYWNREERQHIVVVDEDFSPEPDIDVPELTLCREVNTLSFTRSGDTSGSTLFGAVYTAASFTLASGFDAGWATVGFNGVLTGGGLSLTGLPVIGFSAISNTNRVLEIEGENVLSNYLGNTEHKASRVISAPAP